MKKMIFSLIAVVVAGGTIAMVLSGNKKRNEEKMEIVNQGSGAAAVNIVPVARQQLDLQFSANGNFAPNQDLRLLAENSGRVVSILVKEGDRVSKGQILAKIDDKYLSLELENANDTYQKLKTDKDRYESSFKTGGVTQAQLDDIALQLRNAANRVEQARRKSADADIKAPISGIINKKYIEVGAYLSAGTQLFDIVDVSLLKLNVAVNEKQVAGLKKGDKVMISVPVFPDKQLSGTISFIALKADGALNFPVEMKVNNPGDHLIRAGMYATASFRSNGKVLEAILIPRSAFIGSVNSGKVYVMEGESNVRLQSVTPGAIIGEEVEILSGLNEGDRVVVTGQINLTDGAEVLVQN